MRAVLFTVGLTVALAAVSMTSVAQDADVLRERELGVMGTNLQVRAIGPDAAALDAALDAAVQEIQRVEDLMTDWRPSELTRLNEAKKKVNRTSPSMYPLA